MTDEGRVLSSQHGFAVDAAGRCQPLLREQDHLDVMGITPAQSAAYDLLTDDGMPAEKAASIVLGMQRYHEKGGKDPEAQARHIIKLRKALR